MNELNGTGAPTVSDYQRVVAENWELQNYVELLSRRLQFADKRLAEVPTKAQLKAILDENATLTRMNAILLRRNEILNQKQR